MSQDKTILDPEPHSNAAESKGFGAHIQALVGRFFGGASILLMIGTCIRVGSGFITLPIALRVIPQPELGLYYTFSGIIGLAALFDFGFAQALARNAAYAMGGASEFSARGLPVGSTNAGPNWALINQLRLVTRRWYGYASIFLGLSSMILGGAFIRKTILEAGLPMQLLVCYLVFAASAAFNFATSYWQCLLSGIGEVKASSRNQLIAQIVGLIALIAGLLSGLGIWSYAVNFAVSAVLGRHLNRKAFLAAAQVPEETGVPIQFGKALSALWPMTWRQGLVMIGAFFIQRGNTLVCSAKLGLIDTASYGLSLNLLNIVFQMAAIPLMVAWPRIGRLRIQRDIPKIRTIFFQRAYLGLVFGICGSMALAFFGKWMLELIGAKTHILSPNLIILLGIIIGLENHHSAYASLVLSENENPFVLPAFVSGIAIVSISWWAASHWGLMGIIATQGLVQLAWNNWWTVLRGLKGLRPARVEA